MLLLQQEEFDAQTTESVKSKILAGLNLPGGESSIKSPDQIQFIKKCLQLLLAFKDITPIIIVEMMVQFILAASLFK